MIDLILQGGLFMGPLLLCSIVGLAVAVDRWFYLRSAEKEADAVLPALDALIAREDIDGVEEFCAKNKTLLTGIFLTGVQKFKQLRDEPDLNFVQTEISRVMEDTSIANTLDLERRTGVLNTVGNVAPLFGFSGTVTGMMRTFEDISASANPTTQVVGAGIREALITTIVGLVIAVPAVLSYNYFVSQVDAMGVRVEKTANGLVDVLVMTRVKERASAQVKA